MNNYDLFDATDELQTIRQWARARYAAPWAVLLAVLLRVAATTEPRVQLPGVIGGRASLNLLAAFVAPSGGGKGISDTVARLAWPAEGIAERPLGSGEGLSAIFATKGKEDVEPITRAIINVPEIDTLAGLASRQGSILLAQLKSLAMGETIGQSNASAATTRIVQAHSYRACMSVGAQPGHTGVIFDDTTGGTPQRFLWAMTIDPDMPGDDIPDPEPLNTSLPFWRDENGIVEIGYGPSEIRETIVAAHLARQRGEADALDGHAMLTRCKVAAVLAIMHHRSVVSELDWELSGVVMAHSNRVRDWVISETQKAARRKVRDRALSRAAGDEVYDDRRFERAKQAIIRWLERDGELASRDLRPKLKANIRDQFTAAIAELVADGSIVEISVENGRRYRLATVHAVPEVQPANTQVNDAVPEVQRVPSLTSIHAVTCRQWFDDHVRQLLAEGATTAHSNTVYAAGEAAGWKIDNLRKVASKSPLVAVAERRPDGYLWNIGENAQATVVTADQWLTGFLTGRGWVKASEVYAAAAAAGWTRDAIKSAALADHIAKRGASIATEWNLTREQESA